MDGYLLLARCHEDDIPLRLFRSEEEAREFVQPLLGQPWLVAALVRPLASAVFALPPTSVLGIDVVRIRDGIPEWVETAVPFTEEIPL